MKKIVAFSFIILLLGACNNKADEPGTDDDTLNTQESFLWQSSLNDSTGKIDMIKVPGSDTLSLQSVIDFLNKDNPNIRLELVKVSNDSIYLKIPNATYLTQQMGSTGPTLYLSEVIYNLTEISGIKYVTLDFEEGDHASPGTFNRESFKEE